MGMNIGNNTGHGKAKRRLSLEIDITLLLLHYSRMTPAQVRNLFPQAQSLKEAFELYYLLYNPALGTQAALQEQITALMIVDAQQKFCRDVPNSKMVEDALVNIARVRKYFEMRQWPTFLLFYSGKAKWVHYTEPLASEMFYKQKLKGHFEIFHKQNGSPFRQGYTDAEGNSLETGLTPFYQRLMADHAQIKNFVICGFNASACVLNTALDTKLMNYNALVLRDACADETGPDAQRNYAFQYMANSGIRVSLTADFIKHADQGAPLPCIAPWEKPLPEARSLPPLVPVVS